MDNLGDSWPDDTPKYGVGDLVWAKVKTYPWWPAQVFDAAYASAKAKSMRKPGRILVAFYGDHTFAWLEHSQILELRPNFEAKVKATTNKSFQCAVLEVLNEVCRRAQLGLQCQCRKSSLENGWTMDGLQVSHEQLRLHKDVRMSKHILNSRRSLSFLKDQALSPRKPFSSSFEASVLHGHVLGIRTGVFADICKDETLDFSSECPLPETSQCVNETRFASTERTTIDIRGRSQTECRKRGNTSYENCIFPFEDWRAKRRHIAGSAVDNDDSLARRRASTHRGSDVDTEALLTSEGPYPGLPKFTGAGQAIFVKDDVCGIELKEQIKSLAPSLNAPSSLCNGNASDILMQISEALQFLAIDPLCHHGFYNTMVRVVPVFLKFRDFVFQKSAGYGTHLRAPGKKETQVGSAQHVDTGTEHDSPNVITKAVRYWRPTNQKYRSVGLAHNTELENSNVLHKHVQQMTMPEQCAAPTKVRHEGEGKVLSSDREWEKTRVVLGMSPEGVSQAHSSAQKTVFFPKLDVHELLLAAQRKKSGSMKEAPGKAPGKVQEKALEVSSACGSKLFSEAHTVVWVDAAKQQVETKCLSDPIEELPEAASKQVETKSLRDPIEERPEAASKMFAFERHVSASAPDIEVSAEMCFTTKPEHHSQLGHKMGTSRGDEERGGIAIPCDYIVTWNGKWDRKELPSPPSSSPKLTVPCDYVEREVDGVLGSAGNLESSIQIPDYGASLQRLPVRLFMKFPSSFALPSETQLNAMFTAFGAVETAGTRVFRETASAQVIFKYANEAENAYKCVKEVNPFGIAPVAFRLQHFAHSSG